MNPTENPEAHSTAPYFENLVAWLSGRAGLSRAAVESRLGGFSCEVRRYCAVRVAFLDERRSVEDKLSHKRPDFDAAYSLPDGDPAKARLPAPSSFLSGVREFPVEGSLKKEGCKECGGRGSTDCTACGGKGRIDCDACGGSGLCPACKGAKTVECPACKGNPSTPCPHCGGKGWVKRGYETVKCGHCLNGFIICEECGGRGRLDCPTCFGRGACNDCKGIGSRACIKCGTKGFIVCEACNGVGEWYTWKVIRSVLSTRTLARVQRPEGLPPEVAERVSGLLSGGRAVFERELSPDEPPPLDEMDEDIRPFVREAWESISSERGAGSGEIARRLTVTAVPVARVSFNYEGTAFEGFFAGERKEFFASGDPVRTVLTAVLDRAEELVREGRCGDALESALEIAEQAAAEPGLRLRFRDIVLRAQGENGRAFLHSSLLPIFVSALLAPTWLDWRGHLAGTAAAILTVLVPLLLVRLMGRDVCFCDAGKSGRLAGAVPALAAALPSWFLSPFAAFACGVVLGAAGGAAVFVFLRKRFRRLSASEKNLITLCLREP